MLACGVGGGRLRVRETQGGNRDGLFAGRKGRSDAGNQSGVGLGGRGHRGGDLAGRERRRVGGSAGDVWRVDGDHRRDDGADELVGTPGVDVIVGLGGDDFVLGLGGHDVLCGGNGADEISARLRGSR